MLSLYYTYSIVDYRLELDFGGSLAEAGKAYYKERAPAREVLT
jgi:hypothetical protein